MKAFKSVILKSAILLMVMTLVCGVVYTGVVTGIAQLFFHDKANGSIIEIDGVKYGSELMSQYYQDESHMWGRMMVPNTTTFKDSDNAPLLYSVSANANVTSQEYAVCLEERIASIKAAHPEMEDTQIPVDLITCSASGLDPDISLAAAEYQAQRLSKTNNIPLNDVQSIIDRCTTHKVLGIFGEDTVNVLKVNLMLDGIF